MSDAGAVRGDQARVDAGDALIDAGRYEDAAAIFRKVLIDDPGNADVMATLAAMDVICGRPDVASSGARAALALAPRQTNVIGNALFVAMRMIPGDPLHLQRRSLLTDLIELDPDGEQAGPASVNAMVDLEMVPQACERAEEILRRRPEDPAVLRAAGRAHLVAAESGSRLQRRRHRARASELLREALALDPANSYSLALLSDAAAKSSRRVESVEHAVSAVQTGDLGVAPMARARTRWATLVSVWVVLGVTTVAAMAATMLVSPGTIPPWAGAAMVWTVAAGGFAYEHRVHRRLMTIVPPLSRPRVHRDRAGVALIPAGIVIVASVFFLVQDERFWIPESDDEPKLDRCVVGTSIVTVPTTMPVPSVPSVPRPSRSPQSSPTSPSFPSIPSIPSIPTVTSPPVVMPQMGPCPPGQPSADDLARARRVDQLERLTAPGSLLVGLGVMAWSARALLVARRLERGPAA